MKYTALRDGRVVDQYGEFIPVIDDPETVNAVTEWVAAKGQEKHWHERVKALEEEMRSLNVPERGYYSGIVLGTQRAVKYRTDALAVADYLYDNPAEVDDLLALVAASTGFRREASLSQSMRAVLDMMTEKTESPYYVSSVAVSAEKRDPWEGTK